MGANSKCKTKMIWGEQLILLGVRDLPRSWDWSFGGWRGLQTVKGVRQMDMVAEERARVEKGFTC